MKDKQPGYHKFDKKQWIAECDPEEIAAVVAAYNCENVILTGGEPMLQQVQLYELMQRLRRQNANYRFEVETNGTILPNTFFEQTVDQYNVSPKLENSNNTRKLRKSPQCSVFFGKSEGQF